MERLPSDHPSIESVRATVARHGGARRRVEVPRGVLPDEDTVRVVLDEEVHFGTIVHQEDVDWLTGIYASPRLARENSGEEFLDPWLTAHDRNVGASVNVDVITEGFAIGLRAPGARELYPTVTPPNDSLADIARSLEDDG